MKPNGFINCNERKRGILISMNNKLSIRFKAQFVSSLKVIPLYLKCFSSENQSNVRTFNSPTENWPVALGWRIHRLILCKGLRLPSSPNDCSGYSNLRSSFISMWHKAEWMGHPMRLELTRVSLLVKLANHYNTKQFNSEVLEYSFIVFAPWSILARSDWALSMGQIRRIKLCTYAKLNCLKLDCFDIQTAYLC